MLQAGPDPSKKNDIAVPRALKESAKSKPSRVITSGGIAAEVELTDRAPARRRTPRHSIIVVLPEDHVVSPERLERIRDGLDEDVDVLVACAGQPTNLNALQRSVGEAQFLLAPAGTSIEDLRELALRQTSGDIVRLLSGARADATQSTDTQLSMTS